MPKDGPIEIRSRTELQAYIEALPANRPAPERFCADCGGVRPKGCQRCHVCARRRAREMARNRKRRQRQVC